MATATLHRDSQPAQAGTPTPDVERIPPFWSSLFNATPANDDHHAHRQTEKPSAVVGSLWIQIR